MYVCKVMVHMCELYCELNIIATSYDKQKCKHGDVTFSSVDEIRRYVTAVELHAFN